MLNRRRLFLTQYPNIDLNFLLPLSQSSNDFNSTNHGNVPKDFNYTNYGNVPYDFNYTNYGNSAAMARRDLAGKGYLLDLNIKPIWNLQDTYPLLFRIDRTPMGYKSKEKRLEERREEIEEETGPEEMNPIDLVKLINMSLWDSSLWTLRGPIGITDEKFIFLKPEDPLSKGIAQTKREYRAEQGKPLILSGIVRFENSNSTNAERSDKNDCGIIEIRIRSEDILSLPIDQTSQVIINDSVRSKNSICLKLSQNDEKIYVEASLDINNTQIVHQIHVKVSVKNFKYYISDNGENNQVRMKVFCRCSKTEEDTPGSRSVTPKPYFTNNLLSYDFECPIVEYLPDQKFFVSITKMGSIVTEVENLSIS
ncbi:unnamed protein product [Gordionus sp. m RMFG-2023]